MHMIKLRYVSMNEESNKMKLTINKDNLKIHY